MVNPKKRENLESSERTTKQHSGKNNINDGIRNKKSPEFKVNGSFYMLKEKNINPEFYSECKCPSKLRLFP